MVDTVEPLSDDATAAWAALVRVSQDVLSRVESDLKAAGFPPLAWYDALLELERASDGGLRPYELQDRMLLAQYNISRLVERLVSAGCAERRICEEDGRGRVLAITSRGRDLRRRMWPAYRAAIASHFAERLDAGDAAGLSRILRKLR